MSRVCDCRVCWEMEQREKEFANKKKCAVCEIVIYGNAWYDPIKKEQLCSACHRNRFHKSNNIPRKDVDKLIKKYEALKKITAALNLTASGAFNVCIKDLKKLLKGKE